ncbi:MAG: DUF6064 family protein [Massilia sp.]
MSEWWTYSLSDFLMFSARTYFRLLELYNRAVWPAHLAAAAGGIALVVCALRGGERAGRDAALLLGLCWLWVGWAFHAQRYATINSAAPYFAGGFAVQGLLLLWTGAVRGHELLGGASGRARFGRVLLLLAVLGYPLLAPATGRPWPQAELFGIAPDPTAAATLGFLLLSRRAGWPCWIVPLLWCAISGATLWTMHTPEAWVLPLIALLALLAAAGTDRHAA